VLDGFPRTLTQADALDLLLDDRQPLVVVDIEVPESTLIDRLKSRRICRACGLPAAGTAVKCPACGGELVARTDDEFAIVSERLKVYTRESQPIVEFYRRRSTFRSVDGDQPQDAVAADIAAAVASVVGVR
jgi:adenylate kinase